MKLRRVALDSIIAHAQREAPHECCGLLVGGGDCIADAVPARNVCDSPTRYRIDPTDHFATIRRVRQEGRAIIGAYHSHPASPATPSPTDIAEAFDQQFLHVIVSLRDARRADVRAYRIGNGTFQEVPLITVP